MKKRRPHRSWSLIALTAILALFAPPVVAGGGPGDVTSQQAHGTHFFGEVKDVAGFKPLEGVRVKVAIAGTHMFLVVLTDEDGRFRLEGFGRDVPAEKVRITCDKDGYRVIQATHRHVSGSDASPIAVECLLSRQPPSKGGSP